jgi:hypothetical protein|tara:strand:- start:1294 stop:1611 length:318 start_codon:yes stop_codon:yes gene_type:complete
MSEKKTEQIKSSSSIQEKVEAVLASGFGRWGSILTHNPHKVFWISLLVFIMFSGGMSQRAAFPDESEIWTPKNNPSMIASKRQKEMFPSEGGFIGLLFEVNDPIA